MSTIDIGPRPFPAVLHLRSGNSIRRYVPERTFHIVERIDRNPASYGGIVRRCSACNRPFSKVLFQDGRPKFEYCPRCGARLEAM